MNTVVAGSVQDTIEEESFNAAPGSVVVIRDPEWLVAHLERATDGWYVQGLSELVKDTEATSSTALDDIKESNARHTQLIADGSPGRAPGSGSPTLCARTRRSRLA